MDKERRISADNLAELGPWSLLRPYRARVAGACAMLLVTACLALSLPRIMGKVIEALRGPSPATEVAPLALAMVGIAILAAAARITSRVLLFNSARMAEFDLRSILFRHLLILDSSYFRQHPTGDVMSRLTSDVQTVRAIWGPGLLNIVNTSVLVVVALILMLQVDPMLTLWALLPYPSMVILGLAFGRRIYKTSHKVQSQLGKLSSSVQQDLSGIAIIKSYNLEQFREEEFAAASATLMEHNIALSKIRGQLVPTLTAVSALGTVIMLFVGGGRVIGGHIRLGQLIEFNGYLAALVWPTLAMGWMISLLQRGRASWERLRVILSSVPQIASGIGPHLSAEDARGDLRICGLSLSIGDTKILTDISLHLAPGTTTAIVGRTGSGKTSLISTLPRLNAVADGMIFLDGRDINSLPLHNLRSLIGYAPQEAFLFSSSIAENIRYGVARRAKPPKNEDEYAEAIMEAATAAGLARDLAALPEGLDTVVGERGITLSGGQRQRVALARALATKPSVLILDDSLSSVDADTEREILGHLGALMADRTSIILSHRLAAVRGADQIAVLDNGALVELGRHEALLCRGGVYAEIYDSQRREGVLDE